MQDESNKLDIAVDRMIGDVQGSTELTAAQRAERDARRCPDCGCGRETYIIEPEPAGRPAGHENPTDP